MHHPYEIKLGHPADFKVSYRFYSEEEGGRVYPPFQGIRFDFWYTHPHHIMKGVFMIWPEFEDASGNLILDLSHPVPLQGIARMWIINDALRPYHQDKIEIGARGYFLEGSRKVADCEIIELVGLMSNPVAPL